MKKILIAILSMFIITACHHHQGAQSISKGNPIRDNAAPAYAPAPPHSIIKDNRPPEQPHPGDRYVESTENPFIDVEQEAISTFSIDADGASYANIRRFLQDDNQLPPSGAIRTEEMINYFDMGYDFDNTNEAIALNGEVSACPWNKAHKLVRIGIQGKPLDPDAIPPSNFVFLIDVSGSMSSEDKLELLKNGFLELVNTMSEKDRVAIVTYAGRAGVVLPSTSGKDKSTIRKAIRSLGSGGSTAGAEGITTAYEIAEDNFIQDGNNRIILGTDGDFNVGISNTDALIKLIEEKRESGLYLTVMGVGRGNLNDAMLEQIANHGNGTYEYIDCIKQLRKVFITERSKFFAVAKDVKVQIKFSPQTVQSYRLIGYENRILATEDFEDDSKDAGEIGAGQNITALYEILPVKRAFKAEPMLNIDFRYKSPEAIQSKPLSLTITDNGNSFGASSDHMRFVASVAAFSMMLRDSEYKGDVTYQDIIRWSESAMSYDPEGFRAAFRDLVRRASGI